MKMRWFLPVVVIAVVILYCYMGAWLQPANPINTKGYTVAPAAKPVANVSTVPVNIAVPVKVIPKTVAVEKLGLPADISNDIDKQIISTADIPATKGGVTAVTFLDTRTGIAGTMVKEKPRPFIGIERGTEIGARYGLNSNGINEMDVFMRRDFLRLGTVYVAGYGEANLSDDGNSEAKAMIEISARW